MRLRRLRLHHVVVGPDPEAPELAARNAEVSHEVRTVSIGVDEDSIGETEGHSILELEPSSRCSSLLAAVAVVGGLLQRHERVEEHRSTAHGGDRLGRCDVGVSRKAHQHQVDGPAQCVAHEGPECAARTGR